MFAGSFRGITQTAPLAIYERFSTDFTGALALSAVLVAVSARAAAVGQAARRRDAGSAVLRVEAATRLGAFALDVALEVPAGDCLALAGPVGRGQDLGAARRRRPAAARARARRPAARRCGSTRERGIDVAPERRRCGYVFQEYALFAPPARVAERRLPAARRAARASGARRALELLERFGVAAPRRRRGRGRCRAASASASRVARALARAPARAAARRAALGARRALRAPPAGASSPRVLREAGVPALLVTHDFTEAALLGDARRRDRRRPRRPARARPPSSRRRRRSAFVADFTGAVVLTGTAHAATDGLTRVALDGGGIVVEHSSRARAPVAVSVYPWEIALAPAGTRAHRLGAEPPRRRGRLRHRGRQPRPRRPRRAAAADRRAQRRLGARARPAPGRARRRDLEGGRDAPAAPLTSVRQRSQHAEVAHGLLARDDVGDARGISTHEPVGARTSWSPSVSTSSPSRT